MYLCLDLSLKCSGYAKFNKKGNLMKKGRIIPSKDLSNCMKIHFITTKIKGLFPNVEHLIIEDLYLKYYFIKGFKQGFKQRTSNFASLKWLSRLSGAILSEWVDYSYKDPKFYTASEARKLVGIKPSSQKAEIQIFILDKYKFASKKIITKYQQNIADLKLLLNNYDIKKSVYKYRMGKLSNLIFEETGYDENQVDAILLGLAYQEENKNVK